MEITIFACQFPFPPYVLLRQTWFFLAQGISVARHYYVVLSHGLSCDLDITLSQTPILNISQQSVPCMNKWYSLDNIASISL